MAHETSKGLAYEAPHEAGQSERVEPEKRDVGRGESSDAGGVPDAEDGLLEAIREALGPCAGPAATAPEGQVREDVLLRRLRDFICGASVKEGWRG